MKGSSLLWGGGGIFKNKNKLNLKNRLHVEHYSPVS